MKNSQKAPENEHFRGFLLYRIRQEKTGKNSRKQGQIFPKISPMSLTADVIRERFPGRAELGPGEVAAVLHGRTDRSAVQRVREELERGILVPGLRKRGGRWRVPVGPLVAALDGLIDTPPPDRPAPAGRHTVVIPAPVPPQKRRGRVPDAVRLANAMAWGSAVLFELSELERLDHLAAANEQANQLNTATGPARGKSRPPIRP